MYVAFENKCIWFCCAISYWEDEWFPTLLKGGAWLAIVIYNSMGGCLHCGYWGVYSETQGPSWLFGTPVLGPKVSKGFLFREQTQKTFFKTLTLTADPTQKKTYFWGFLNDEIGSWFLHFLVYAATVCLADKRGIVSILLSDPVPIFVKRLALDGSKLWPTMLIVLGLNPDLNWNKGNSTSY